jgi:hypothetical protein
MSAFIPKLTKGALADFSQSEVRHPVAIRERSSSVPTRFRVGSKIDFRDRSRKESHFNVWSFNGNRVAEQNFSWSRVEMSSSRSSGEKYFFSHLLDCALSFDPRSDRCGETRFGSHSPLRRSTGSGELGYVFLGRDDVARICHPTRGRACWASAPSSALDLSVVPQLV